MKKLTFALFLFITVQILTAQDEITWPKEINSGAYIVTIYTPET